MTAQERLAEAASVEGLWFHSIEWTPGQWTKGHKTPAQMDLEISAWKFPDDLTGKRVLDIGCADGGWSVAAIKRGAESVLAIDEQMTSGMRLLQEAKAFPQIEFRQIDLFSNAFMELPTFDFVIFTGVLYHVHDMLEALKRVRARAAGRVLLETHVNESLGDSLPAAIFYERNEFNNDSTNWWGPNIPCLEALLRTAGFDFQANYLVWEDDRHRNGRVSYILEAAEGSVFGSVTGSATGSFSMLEWARDEIERLSAENARLKSLVRG